MSDSSNPSNSFEALPPEYLDKFIQRIKAETLARPKEVMDDAIIKRKALHKIVTYFPDTGPYCRELYPKHMEFFAAGNIYRERLLVAANRIGKSESGAYESTCHLTGIYPDWWRGKRFTTPVEGWACGTSTETTRDIVQMKLIGPVGSHGTGMIPKHLIVDTTPRRGVPNAIESIVVRHISGRNSVVSLKTYEQGRKSFEGTSKHFIWDDEEPPVDIYGEQVLRTTGTGDFEGGIIYTTFTPLQGMSEVVKSFLHPDNLISRKYKWYIQAGWNDVPHIPKEEKESQLATMSPHLVDARTKGEPYLGVGAIYPFLEDEIVADMIDIPDTWPRSYGMDVGWNRTAAVWGARNPADGVVYIYSEHYQGGGDNPNLQAVANHAYAIKSRGEWIQGVIDPASNGRSQIDGRQLISLYRGLGLNVTPAANAVSAGIEKVFQLFSTGKLKILRTCPSLLLELKRYHRDDKGNIVKRDDHACFTPDTLVWTRSGLKPIADITEPVEVLGPNGEWVVASYSVLTRSDTPIVCVTLHNNKTIRCTPDHLFMTEAGWIPAMNLQGLNLVLSSNETISCMSVVDAGRSDVYCINVPETSAFCLESGVVVHNCDALRYLIMSGMDRMHTRPKFNPPTKGTITSGRGWMQ